jgi:hypothetical protein
MVMEAAIGDLSPLLSATNKVPDIPSPGGNGTNVYTGVLAQDSTGVGG